MWKYFKYRPHMSESTRCRHPHDDTKFNAQNHVSGFILISNKSILSHNPPEKLQIVYIFQFMPQTSWILRYEFFKICLKNGRILFLCSQTSKHMEKNNINIKTCQIRDMLLKIIWFCSIIKLNYLTLMNSTRCCRL